MTAHSIRKQCDKDAIVSSYSVFQWHSDHVYRNKDTYLWNRAANSELLIFLFFFLFFFRRGTYAVAFAANLIVLNLPNLHTCRPNIKTIVYREQQQQQQQLTSWQRWFKSVEVFVTANSKRSNVIGPSGGAALLLDITAMYLQAYQWM